LLDKKPRGTTVDAISEDHFFFPAARSMYSEASRSATKNPPNSRKKENCQVLIALIADYEARHFTIEKVPGVEVLKESMAANGLRQKQMKKLGQRFHVSPAIFF
jgi:antitoxin component HigA of HigAB toxin-antitoxin module